MHTIFVLSDFLFLIKMEHKLCYVWVVICFFYSFISLDSTNLLNIEQQWELFFTKHKKLLNLNYVFLSIFFVLTSQQKEFLRFS